MIGALACLVGIVSGSGTNSSSVTYATWNPSDKGSNVTLSNTDLTASLATSIGGGRSTIGKSSGKWYWEITILSMGYTMVGVSDNSVPVNTDGMLGAGAHQYVADHGFRCHATWTPGNTYGTSLTVNSVVGIALDMDAGTITFYGNGTSYGIAFTGITGTMYALVSAGSSLSSQRANFGATAFTYPVPYGYNSGFYL